MESQSVKYLLAALFLALLYGNADAVFCSQCNMPQWGIANTCKEPRNMTNCMGCVKTLTKVKLRDSGYINGWERKSEVISRYCMRHGSLKVKPAGCYKWANNGGYTEQCFCYHDNCNSGASRFMLAHFGANFLSYISPALSSPVSAVTFLSLLVVMLVRGN